MPPLSLIDLDQIDCDHVLYTREQIYEKLPQRGEFMQLDGIVHLDLKAGTVVGYRDIRSDEWWCSVHMPDKPVFPGVLMVEGAAQLAAFVDILLHENAEGFTGFGGIDKAKFRDQVTPPARILFLCRAVEIRLRRFICDCQAYVEGKLVFEGRITGLRLKW